jgi:hypothetical protein
MMKSSNACLQLQKSNNPTRPASVWKQVVTADTHSTLRPYRGLRGRCFAGGGTHYRPRNKVPRMLGGMVKKRTLHTCHRKLA